MRSKIGNFFHEKMQQNKTNSEEEWNISGSEDEADTPSAAKAGSRQTETGMNNRANRPMECRR